MEQDDEVEDLTSEEMKCHPILYCKQTRRTINKENKIETAIIKVHAAVKKAMKIDIPMRVIYQVWADSLASAKIDLKKESHYKTSDMIENDEEDYPIFSKLLAAEHKQMMRDFEERSSQSCKKKRNTSKSVTKEKKKVVKHRTGRTSKLPEKKKGTLKHPKLDSFAEKKVQQQEELIEEFCRLKEQFIANSNKVIEHSSSDYWPLICEKYQSIDTKDFDACTNEAIAELEKLYQE